jgi:hypothetical protein
MLVHVLSKYVVYYFAYLIGNHVRFFQTQLHICKYKHIRDTMMDVRKFLFSFSYTGCGNESGDLATLNIVSC